MQDLDRVLPEDELLGTAAALAHGPDRLYAYGDYVLEALTGRRAGGILVACRFEAEKVACELSRAAGLTVLDLKSTKGAFHLAGSNRGERGVTVVPFAVPDIKEHLSDCGFTVTAMAVDIAAPAPRQLIDPFGGLKDLQKGRLRTVSSNAFVDDPARLLRAAQLSFTYRLDPATETEALMRASADLANTLLPYRTWNALSGLFNGEDLSAKARFLARTGVLGALFPEVGATYEVPQNYYHHLGVWEHTLEVLDVLEEMLLEPHRFFPAFAPRISGHMAGRVRPGVDRRSVLLFAALVHDIGKPAVMACEPSGRIRFQGHQAEGARLTAGIAARMGLGRSSAAHLVGLVADHMRLGLLLKGGESAETRLRAVRELGQRCIEVVLLSLADRMATRGPASTEEAMELYKRMTSRVLADYFWETDYPPLVDGRDVMMHTGIEQGPEVRRALFKARVAQREATISSREAALEYLAPDFKGRMNR